MNCSGMIFISPSSTSRGVLPGASGWIGDPEDMGVDSEGRRAERDVEHHVAVLRDAGQGFQRVAIVGDFAAVFADQRLRKRDDVLGLR